MSKEDVESLPIGMNHLNGNLKKTLEALSTELYENLECNKQRVVYKKKSGEVIYDQFWPEQSKAVMDKIDQVLAKYYVLSQEELDFIINYDIKYRMGRDTEEDSEE